MKEIKKKSVFRTYFESIQIEHEHDLLYHNYFSSYDYIRLLPKPFTFQKYLNNFDKFLNLIIPFVIPFWIFLLHPIIVVILFVKYFVTSLVHKKIIIEDSIYLDASDSKYFSTIDKKDPDFPKTVINIPFKKTKSISIEGLQNVNFFSLTNLLLIIKSVIYSIAVIRHFFKSPNRKMIFYSYMSFKWFLVYFTLNNTKIKSVWISNHHDRWTGLTTNLDEVLVTLVQHGQLYFYDHVNKVKLFHSFSKKINRIKKIYVTDNISKKYFKSYIENNDLKFSTMKSNLELISWRTIRPLIHKILIIGNHIQMSFQMKISNELYRKYGTNIDVCYKYHPRQTNQITNNSIWEIQKDNIIPEADIVISYGSSIDHEIEQIINCKLVYYDYLDKNGLSQLMSEINNLIKI